jgi:hypothetical protein
VAWALIGGLVTAVVVYFVTFLTLRRASVFVGGGILAARGDGPEIAAVLTFYLSLLGPPVVAAVVAGRRERWWRPVLLCQAIGAASAGFILAMSPDRFGLAIALTVVTSWAVAAVVCGSLCAIRRRVVA